MSPLTTMLGSLYHSLAEPLIGLTLGLAYLIGLSLMISGAWRLYLAAHNAPMRTSPAIWRLLGGAVILAFPAWLDVEGKTLFEDVSGPEDILSYLAPEAAASAEAVLVWTVISWAASLFGAWCFIWSWITLSRAADPGSHIRWEHGVLQMVCGVILYFNDPWLEAVARSAGLIG